MKYDKLRGLDYYPFWFEMMDNRPISHEAMEYVANHLRELGLKDTTITLVSTPNGQRGYFYEMWNKMPVQGEKK